ncbi:glucosamine inositolphosphorylceramide transferase family protein [Nitrobacter sp.]|uniref:glucosamine inositolphosphorylceramide transferase family protein n=1 Tax=Nitrobacter sp. TaxID=29420 RepID=UPI00399D6CFB
MAHALAEVPDSQISRSFAPLSYPLPPGSRLLFELERLIYGFRGLGAMDRMESALLSLPLQQAGQADVVIDLSGEETSPEAPRILRPFFNGVPSEIGIMAALANDQDLLVELHDTARPSNPWTARPASQDREVFSASLDASLSCATALILKALHHENGSLDFDGVPRAKSTKRSSGPMSALGFATSSFAAKSGRLLDKIIRGGKCWAIGWRFDETASLFDKREAPFQVLSGGSSGYLADPFPFRHNGQDFIFVEQYLYSKSRGCIAVVALDRNGAASAPRIVLEESHHLSYPFVFAHEGQIWMIPESGAARHVALYRAVEFPYRWTREACLMEKIEGYDVTPLRDQDGFWFFVSPRLWTSSSWDMLDLYHADSLTASWTRHGAGPALIDARFSRPAGAVIERNGHYLRPAQDCSRGYGGAVTLCRIDAISFSDFIQVPVGRIEAGSFGCHTYNRHAGCETIDIFGQVGGLQEATVSYVPLGSDTRSPATVDEPALPAGLGIGLATRS